MYIQIVQCQRLQGLSRFNRLSITISYKRASISSLTYQYQMGEFITFKLIKAHKCAVIVCMIANMYFVPKLIVFRLLPNFFEQYHIS